MNEKLTISGNIMPQLNFSMQQNYIPLIRNLILTNNTDELLKSIKLCIVFSPEFASAFETVVLEIAPKSSVEISPVKINVSTDFLYSLTERMIATLHIEAVNDDEGLFIDDKSVELLPYDQWAGINCIPELISAFVTPNHPAVSQLVSKASAYLEKWGASPSFTGYQMQDVNTAKLQAAAIYAALQAESIAYNMPPASYEIRGQRVRLPNTVLEQKCGTCLDLAVLYCACLEYVWLNPIIVITKEHAFAGFWLEPETFNDCCEDDISSLTKRIAEGIDKICLVECTDFTSGDSISFDHAEKHAKAHLEDVSDFRVAIDVSRSRGSGIRPIPMRISADEKIAGFSNENSYGNNVATAPKEIDMSLHGNFAEVSKEVTKQEIWERKLLDLSLRNSLLNFRPSSSNVQIMASNLAALEDAISSDNDFKIMSAPSDITLAISDSKIFEIENEKDLITAIAESEFKNNRLRTFIKDDELEKTMKKLRRQAKISIEENGANTLYLALGFLRWFESDKSVKPRYAPIVLIPVDIVKKVQDKNYSIRIRDEETQMNITLLEMLRQFFGIDISGLSPLPEDENGVNLQLVFNTVRQSIMANKRWDVEEISFLGQFSFNQFIMWNDIRNRSEDLKKNKVVASLISGQAQWQFDDIKITAEELDKNVLPSDMAIPTSADSSQLAAIYEAAQGESFVLHGPPGTGKSQTITNMIANALYNGKSVLFVAEKMAALSVVQKRLEKIGLAPFCLELHSNKAQKKSVLGQLEKTLETGHIKPPEEFENEAQALHNLRTELNDVVYELHKKRKSGFSLFEAITEAEKLNCFSDMISELPSELIKNADTALISSWSSAVRDVETAGKENGGYASSPLKNIHATEYASTLRDRLVSLCNSLLNQAQAAQDDYHELKNMLGINGCDSYESWKSIVALTALLTQTTNFLTSALDEEKFAARKPLAQTIITNGLRYKALCSEISVQFEPSIESFDADAALLEWKKTQQKWALAKHFGTKKQVNELALYAKPTFIVTEDNISEIYGKLSEKKQLKASLSSVESAITELFGTMWLGNESDFPAMQTAMEASEKIASAVSRIREKEQIKTAVVSYFNDSSKREAIKSIRCENSSEALLNTISAIENELSADITELTVGESWFSSARNEADKWLSGAENLRDRTVLEKALKTLEDNGLSIVSDAYMREKVSEENLANAFKYEISRAVVGVILKETPELSAFQGAKYDDTVRKFKEAAEKFQTLTIQELCARLSSKIPTGSSSAGSSEISILQKAIKSNGRMLPIRKLFDSIPNLLRRICPCMLMSPISVAQYIDPSFPKFDLVIFDEASQMPTCEAVGAIARGENVVVVGDPKQLPPTSFFNANQVDEENFEKEDLESVLDDCLALAMPQTHLLWHYRSRHESLIAYSNAKYYDNKLLTFPSPDDLVSEVKWVHVDGYYDKGNTKQNPAEAAAIVAEIVRRLKDENLRKESIGVVAFSSVQQILIDDMLNEEFSKSPELETIAESMYEPILVKNLENVQGDERDVILFSVGYGPDKDGKVTMNFGPLNRDGGWRRLNVAISRSRKSMTVYSVITPEQIDLSKTRSDGVAGLKGFLEFAARGKSALAVNVSASVASSEDFEQMVAHEIKKLGYNAKCNIGTSEYKIDIGIVNPEDPEMYILGVMCDGRKHIDAATARDRNILQPSVLRGLGWNVFNFHILDWLDNKNKVLGKIEEALIKSINDYKQNGGRLPEEEKKREEPLVFEKEEQAELLETSPQFIPAQIGLYGTPESFHTPENKQIIISVIKKIVDEEAPVSQRALFKRVISAWDISRTGAKIEATFGAALAAAKVKYNESNGGIFLWRDDQNPSEYSAFRAADFSGEKRAMDDISAEEIANGIVDILKSQISLEKTDMIRETAKLFGYSRTSAIIETAIENGIKYAVSNGRAKLDENGKLTLI